MDIADTLGSQLTRNIPYPFLVEAMTPFLNMTALEELVVLMFHLRNVHGGKGERHLFRDMMCVLYEFDKSLVIALLPLIPYYGYWKDVFYFSTTLPHVLGPTMELCERQLIDDELRSRLAYSPSLMSKYIPKQGKKYKAFANSFAKHLYPDIPCHSARMKHMRKRISALNSKTVEVKMCANEWDSIEPRTVPVIARNKYLSAFLKDGTEERAECRRKFIEFLGNSSARVQPAILTAESISYSPVRNLVRGWISSRLNASE